MRITSPIVWKRSSAFFAIIRWMIAESFLRHAGDDLFRRHERLVGVLRHQLHGGRPVERRPAGHQDVERAAERVDVGAVIDGRGVAALLGRHVGRRAERDPRTGHVGRQRVQPAAGIRRTGRGAIVRRSRRGRLHQPEVGDLHQPLLVEQQVVGLHVAVDHAAVVGVLEPAGRLEDVADGGLGVELAAQLARVPPATGRGRTPC